MRRVQEEADPKVDLIARKLENGPKPGLKITFRRLEAHLNIIVHMFITKRKADRHYHRRHNHSQSHSNAPA